MATLRSEEDARKWAHKHQKASQAKEAIEEQIHTCRAESFPWNREDKEYPNAIYVGRADIFGDQKRFAYYIGQSKRPLKRWKSHVASGTGCTQFSDDTDPEWAILAWDIPTASMDVAESYLIGYFLAMFGCVNGNRGKSEYAFRRGYLDGVHRKQPAVCARISLDELNWCDVVYEYAGNEGVAEVFHPAGDNKLLDQRWGFHLVGKRSIWPC